VNCLQSSIQYILRSRGVKADNVPDGEAFGRHWMGPYDRALEASTGHTLRGVHVRPFLPPGDDLWIAGLDFGSGDGHAVVCRGSELVFDPAGELDTLPFDKLRHGFEVCAI